MEELDDNDLGFQARDAGMSALLCLGARCVRTVVITYYSYNVFSAAFLHPL